MDRRRLLLTGLLAGAAPGPAQAQSAADISAQAQSAADISAQAQSAADISAQAQSAADMPTRFAAALSAGDMAAFAALFSPNYVNHQVSAAAPAPAGSSAKAATVAFFSHRVDALAGLKVSIEAALAQGDLCAASFVYEGVHQGVYYGVAPTGRKLHFTSCDIFRVAGGEIVEHWGMGDIAGVLAQLKA